MSVFRLPALLFQPVLAAALFCAFSGCAVKEAGDPRMAQADRGARAALVNDLQSAQTALTAYQASGNKADLLAFNAACASFASHWKAAGFSGPVVLKTGSGTYRIGINTTFGTYNPARLERILTADQLPNKQLIPEAAAAGWGGAVVGVERPENPRRNLYPDHGVSVPATSVLNFTKETGGETGVLFSLWDPGVRDSLRIAGREHPLAADFGLPFAFYPPSGPQGFLGMLRPGRYEKFRGLYLMQPYDPDKVPLLFVHGLMSSPQMWLPVLAEFEKDPELRDRFQLWVYGYPTGDPIAYLGHQLRESLAAMRKRYPETRDLVVMSHSLGGLLTQLQVVDPGMSLATAIFGSEAETILAASDSEILRDSLVFKPDPHIRRVVFVATPHTGAPMATNFIGRLGSMLIRLPSDLFSTSVKKDMQIAFRRAGIKGSSVPNVIVGLDPRSPLLKALNTRRIPVPYHSIIGVATKPAEPLKDTSDTVVPYWSSHLNGALSEKIVDATHEKISTTPAAIAEMKRIAKIALEEL